MKKSIKIFIDSLDVLDTLNDEQAGQLFKAIRAYEVDKKEVLDGLMKAIFVPFKNNMERADEAYTRTVEANKANGLKGGRPKANGLKRKPNNPKKDKDKDKDKDTYIIPNGINIKAFDAWCDYKGKRYSVKAKTLAVTRLAKYDEATQQEMVDNSIMNSWSGLFELKQQNKVKSNKFTDKVDEYFSKQIQIGMGEIIDARID